MFVKSYYKYDSLRNISYRTTAPITIQKGRKAALNRKLYLAAVITAIAAAYIMYTNINAPDGIMEYIHQYIKGSGRMNETKPGNDSEYMLFSMGPGRNDTPEAVLTEYFDALKSASNLTGKQMAAVGGTVGSGLTPYRRAYQCWSREWREKNSFQEFLDSWQGTAHVLLIKLLPAGGQKDQKRFFVETRHLEVTADKPRSGIFYYTGFFTVGRTREGWRITGGSLKPQNLVWELSGHQPWRCDPVMVAVADGLGLGLQAGVGSPVVRDNPDGTVSVIFSDDNIGEKCAIILYRPYDGMWRVLEKVADKQ